MDPRVDWKGPQSLALVEAALARFHVAEIHLAAEFHHALCTRLGAGEPGAPEHLDLAGGAELLSRLAAIQGLDALAGLASVASGRNVLVSVSSPSPVIRIDLSGDS